MPKEQHDSLPFNATAEKALLCSIILKPELLDELPREWRPDKLYIPAHRYIYEAIELVRERDKMIDFVAVKEELRRRGLLEEVEGLQGLSELFSFVPSHANWKWYHDEIEECWIRRRLILAGQDLIKQASDRELGDPRALAREIAERELLILAQGGRDQEIRPFKDLVYETLDEIEARSKSKGTLNVRFGLSKLDSVLGGLEPGDLAIICAETSFGKSILGMQAVTVGAAKDIGAGVFSFEMPPTQMVERIFSAEAEIPMSSLRSGLLNELEYPKLAGTVTRIANYPIWIVGCYGLDLAGICSSSRYLKAKYGIGLVVIDYLQLVPVAGAGRRRDSSREREVAEISRTLKLLAGELKVVVIGCSQVNDEGKLRESRAIGQDADVVLKIAEPKDSEDSFRRDIAILKHRHGPRAKAAVNFYGQYMKFTDV